jgi:hypothetical protein
MPSVSGVPMFVIGNQALTGLQDWETVETVVGEEMGRNDQAAARSRR